MPTDYRLIVVVRASRVDAANAAARAVDPAAIKTFIAPLRFITSPVTQIDVYISSWRMVAGDGPRLRQALRNAGFSNREVGLVRVGGTPNMTDDLWAFDGTEETEGAWTAVQVRAALGLDFIETVHP